MKELVIELIEDRGEECEGCGNTNLLSLSHLIPKSKRKDLEKNKKNIRLHCMGRRDGSKGCHQRWENKEWESLLDGEENLKIVKELDKNYYELLMLNKK